MCKQTWPEWRGDERAGIKLIMEAVHMDPTEYQLGKTKVFIKTPESVFRTAKTTRDFEITFHLHSSCFCWKRCGSENTTITPGSFKRLSVVISLNGSVRDSENKQPV